MSDLAMHRAITNAEAMQAAADRLAELGYESIRDVFIIARGTALLYAQQGNPEAHQHLMAVRAQLDGLVSEIERGRCVESADDPTV